MRPEQWILSNDTGNSSKAIWAHMMGVEMPEGYPIPYDPSDFGRCFRLLELFPAWKLRLNEMSSRSNQWKRLVSNWELCETLYLRDLPTGKSSELYLFMKTLREG